MPMLNTKNEINKFSLKAYRLLQLGLSYKLKLLKPLGPPYQYSIEATNLCNLKCSFCPQSNPTHKHIRPTGFISPNNFHSIIKMIRNEQSGNKNISVCLDGEPLLNDMFCDLIRISNEEGFIPRFSTNGLLLTGDLVDKLYDYTYVAAVDITSIPDLFDNIRGRKGDYDIVVCNINNMIINALNNNRIKLEIADITHFNGPIDRRVSLDRIRRLFPSNLPSNITFRTRPFHNFGGHNKSAHVGSGRKLCPYPWTSFVVTWDGNVVACCRDTRGRTILGNVFENTIKEIWHGAKYIEMRAILIEGKENNIAACEKCDMPYSGPDERWKWKYIMQSLLRR